MNYRGHYKHIELPECPECGMDSGYRKVSLDGEKFYVVCTSCGFATKPHKTQSAATQTWTKLSRLRKEKK